MQRLNPEVELGALAGDVDEIGYPEATDGIPVDGALRGGRVSDTSSLLMREFLTWAVSRQRTYAEAMEAWRSTCPRHTVWEDALAERLVQLEGGPTLAECRVTLTARGRALLHAAGIRATTAGDGSQGAGRGSSGDPGRRYS